MTALLSVVIPSRDELLLQKTIEDILSKASGKIEVIAVLDGYWPNPQLPDYDNLHVIHRGQPQGMRVAIASAVEIAKGEYIMKSDAHCMYGPGFDEILLSSLEDGWIAIPRRYTLDVEKWEPRPATPEKPYVDYEYFIYPRKFSPLSLHGFRWNDRTAERESILVDDTMTFQGSCWVMKKDWFKRHDFLRDPGYAGSPKQEAEELGLTTWTNGWRVVVNKEVWYAHMHKKHAGYPTDREATEACYRYSYQRWVIEHKEQFIELVERFWPLPGWPENWKDRLWR